MRTQDTDAHPRSAEALRERGPAVPVPPIGVLSAPRPGGVARNPGPVMAATVDLPLDSTSVTRTRAPSEASRRAVASPMPRLADAAGRARDQYAVSLEKPHIAERTALIRAWARGSAVTPLRMPLVV
jgi:hypothetical protein